ncbi:hypothetical protein GCM10027445_22890 [Amycolatopsis endophytica]|uniref:Uncharacterized protein n=1 Tax=Amycolatopsis endophytica TaxID=860233 RepID=A0A853BFX0_9PSEU|nr:hypothetical protein [Amycolatopsis endophytica]NYI93552.1 hypothetical protein [Amycolatopsis endophytica]
MNVQQQRPGLAVASAALGAVGVVMGVSIWVTWAFVRPAAGGALPSPMSVVLTLVLGALWIVVLSAGVLSMLFGFLGRATPGGLARAGMLFGAIAALLALSGAIAFVVAASDWLVVRPL